VSILEIINLVASLASLILAVLAICLAVYFYTQSKNTETNVSGLLEGIRAQTDALQKIVGRQMGQLIRGVTDQPGGDLRLVQEMIGALRDIPASVITLIQAPSTQVHKQDAQEWRKEGLKAYIVAYYYAALTNIANSSTYLPPLDLLTDDDVFRRVQDSSHADFVLIDGWLSALDPEEIRRSGQYHSYQEAFNKWRPFVKDSTGIYRDRANANPLQIDPIRD
jgi:hypothetical protein